VSITGMFVSIQGWLRPCGSGMVAVRELARRVDLITYRVS
jgi:hypothetical protein